MTEAEYTREMLCCTPKELLLKRVRKSCSIPVWLQNIAIEDVKDALTHYDEEKYREMRQKMEEIL